MTRQKRAYKKKLSTALSRNDGFLIEAAQREWERIEQTAKAEEKIRQARAVATVAGKTLLVFLLFTGIVTIVAVAPNIFAAVGRLSHRKRFYDKDEFRKTITYLREKKLIKVCDAKDGVQYELTPKGHARALEISYKNLRLGKEGEWDGLWRIVTSDIPDKHKWARDCFREKMKDMSFCRIQKSVYITPYPCEDEIRFLMATFNLPESSVRVIEAHTIGDERDLRKYFGLKI